MPIQAAQTPADEVLDSFDVDVERGLSAEDARARLSEHGPNRLRTVEARPWWRILADQFTSLIIALLAVAAGVSLAFGEYLEAGAIGAALIVDALIGFVTELRAEQSLEALRELDVSTVRVRRDGEEQRIESHEIVPGDVVLLGEGDVVGADLRLVQSDDLEIEESALTGESVPVRKSTEAVEGDVPVAERTDMAFKGTAVTRGRGVGVVAATGMETEIGQISRMVEEAEEAATPLEERLEGLGRRLIVLVLGVSVVIGLIGVVSGRELRLIIETAIILGVAAVPEGLPIVATLALARGVHRMAKRNALVKRLSAVETLGSTTVIMSDKTGTLTEGRMTVRRLAAADGDWSVDELDGLGPIADEHDVARRMLLAVRRANESEPDDEVGDPTDIALARAAQASGITAEDLEAAPQVATVPFNRETTMMASAHDSDGARLVAVKGAPSAVLAASRTQLVDGERRELDDEERDRWVQRNRELAAEGLRLIGVAERIDDDPGDADQFGDDPYHDLTWLGLIGLLDPPREGISQTIAECHRAGIRVIMVTGDQQETADAIAQQVGLEDPHSIPGRDVSDPDEADEESQQRFLQADVFSRVDPENKLDLIALHQNHGAIVGMTGDGVNDAPALKKADIGIAMGDRGTEVAREAADIVLTDDSLGTIVDAIRYGRTIFGNIRRFIVYLLSGNLGEILAVAVAIVAGLPLPLLPLQILWINFVSDIFPALALGVGPARDDVMDRPPRDPDEPLLPRRGWGEVAAWGVLIAALSLGAMVFGRSVLGLEDEVAVSVSFLTFGLARVWHIFNMRRPGTGIVVNEVTTNVWAWLAVLVGVGLMATAAFVPPVAGVLEVSGIDGQTVGLILAASLGVVVVGQLALVVRDAVTGDSEG